MVLVEIIEGVLSITHVQGKSNASADFQSRNFGNDQTEWEPHPSVFKSVTAILGKPHIDLFASFLNAKVSQYYSWKPEPGAIHVHVDAFPMSWHGSLTYCFPPFISLLGHCLQKISMDQTETIVVMPMWPTQPYNSRATRM